MAFHNPYNFIPALSRDGKKSELRDDQPCSHDRYHLDHYTGRITVRLTVKTPLLIVDAARATVSGQHKTFSMRVKNDGKPELAVTSVKGMLRSAYESITNSRLSIFASHDKRLAYRMRPQEGVLMVPARVENQPDSKKIHLLTGTSGIGRDRDNNWGAAMGPLYAAWLPRFNAHDGTIKALLYPTKTLPKHGDQVEVWLEKFHHQEKGFQFWKVRDIVKAGDNIGPQPPATIEKNPNAKHQPIKDVEMVRASGYVCVTSQGRKANLHNNDKKHDERVFFVNNRAPKIISLSEQQFNELERAWSELISNYQEIHRTEIAADQKCPLAVQHSEWSRHIVNADKELTLKHNTLCFARVKHLNNGNFEIVELYPVNISRRLYHSNPQQFLPENLQPATTVNKLSPADRVFGWVNQQGKESYRGNLRIGRINCETAAETAIKDFGQDGFSLGFPLAILGQPKPQQARFYLAADKNGNRQQDGLSLDRVGYVDPNQKGLRGRKIYPHHNLPANHWHNPTEDRTRRPIGNFHQEYRQPTLHGKEQCTSQNRSITGWVNPDTIFTFDLHITNLKKEELGALIWLLSLPADHFHRLGGGKPLGFGSVRLEIVETDLRTGQDWQQWYQTLEAEPQQRGSQQTTLDELSNAFITAIKGDYGNGINFETVPFIASFLRAARGFEDGLPIHYPRITTAPHANGESFKWFGENERGNRVSLRELVKDGRSDPGLPDNN